MIAVPRDINLVALFGTAERPGGDDVIADLFTRPAWHRDALCQEHPEVTFFPLKGQSVRPAKQLCAACLVKPECRDWAAAQGPELQGIWAGTSPLQRQQMRLAVPLEDRHRASVHIAARQ